MVPIATIASPTRLLTIRINRLNARCMEAPFHLSFVLRKYSALENHYTFAIRIDPSNTRRPSVRAQKRQRLVGRVLVAQASGKMQNYSWCPGEYRETGENAFPFNLLAVHGRRVILRVTQVARERLGTG